LIAAKKRGRHAEYPRGMENAEPSMHVHGGSLALVAVGGRMEVKSAGSLPSAFRLSSRIAGGARGAKQSWCERQSIPTNYHILAALSACHGRGNIDFCAANDTTGRAIWDGITLHRTPELRQWRNHHHFRACRWTSSTSDRKLHKLCLRAVPLPATTHPEVPFSVKALVLGHRLHEEAAV